MARSARPWFRKDRRAWFVTINGTRHNLGPDKTEAFRLFHQLMQQPQSRSVGPQSFAGIADAYLEWLQKHRSPDTFEWYRYRIERFCQRNPDLRFDELRPLHVQQWVDSYAGLSQTSRRNYIRAIKRCVTWAVRQGYSEANTIRDLEVPAAERREVCFTKVQFDAMLQFIPEESFRRLCVITFECGCRPQELLKVEARHFDDVRSRWVFPVKESKGRRQPRIVYLSPFAERMTRELASQYPEGPLFRNSTGSAWTPDAVNCAFTRLQQRMGRHRMQEQGVTPASAAAAELRKRGDKRSLKELSAKEREKLSLQVMTKYATRCSLYALRHSWATAALQSGLDGLTVGILLGHNDPSTLSRVYQHMAHNPEHLLKQARKASKGRQTER